MICFIVKEVFHQYDSMAYPHVSSDSNIVVEFFKTLSSKLTGSKKNEISLPTQNLMQSEALKMYLEEHRLILCEMKFTSSFNIQTFIKEILFIFNSVRLVRHCIGDLRWGRWDTFAASEITEVN